MGTLQQVSILDLIIFNFDFFFFLRIAGSSVEPAFLNSRRTMSSTFVSCISSTYKANLSLKEAPPLRAELGTATYGMNQFADLSEEEFSRYYLSPVTKKDMNLLSSLPEAEEVDVEGAPDEMDWRTKSKFMIKL